MTDQELEKLWATHREATFTHYGAVSYRAEMAHWLPFAATAASNAFIDELAARRDATHAEWQQAWNAAHPDTPIGGADHAAAWEAQQRSIGQLQAA